MENIVCTVNLLILGIVCEIVAGDFSPCFFEVLSQSGLKGDVSSVVGGVGDDRLLPGRRSGGTRAPPDPPDFPRKVQEDPTRDRLP